MINFFRIMYVPDALMTRVAQSTSPDRLFVAQPGHIGWVLLDALVLNQPVCLPETIRHFQFVQFVSRFSSAS